MHEQNPRAYREFLASKVVTAPASGFAVDPAALHPALFPFQRDVCAWAFRRGRAALFLDTGLGKTLVQLEWANRVHEQTDGDVLILAPLAVAQQTAREGAKFGIPVTLCRKQADVRPGVNVTNYELLAHFDPAAFVGVVLDESSILKAYTGATKRRLVDAFRDTPYRLCATATPAPNDVMELGNHAEFLGTMQSDEMLARWFINDTMHFGRYRLKGHAERAFWDWVATWAISIRRPSDLGYPDGDFALPPLNLKQVLVEVDRTEGRGDRLFRDATLNATTLHKEMRLTSPARARRAAELVNGTAESWAVWVNTNYESDAIKALLPDAVEVRGSDSRERKERVAEWFQGVACICDASWAPRSLLATLTEGDERPCTCGHRSGRRILISKSTIFGLGLNFQACHNAVFVGLNYSFEQLYQAIRRHWRFGQTSPVNAYILMAETEEQVWASVAAKMRDHDALMDAAGASRAKLQIAGDLKLVESTPITKHEGQDWTLYHGDCVEVTRQLPDDSVHFTLFSPPFSSLYIYSDSLADMGNCDDDAEFFEHFGYLLPELYRATVPGRLCAVHCKQLVKYKGTHGTAGLRDFRGDIIRHMKAAGWEYHSEVCIWTDPVLEMQRTKAHGLLYKQLRADSSFSRQGLAEYLVLFRKWSSADDAPIEPVTHTREDFPLDLWQRYASPVWFDVRRTRVLNVAQAREDEDSKHLCPLQLDVCDRAIELWTNPGDVVYSPFCGIGSEGYSALLQGRRFRGAELKGEYVDHAIKYLNRALFERKQPTLFDSLDPETQAS